MPRFLSVTLALSLAAGFASAQTTTIPAPPGADPITLSERGSNQPIGSGPALVFERSEHEFGRINDTERVETEFPFANRGDQTLVITGTQASCGCTVPSLDKTEYAPGESGVIRVVFNPQGKAGQKNETITVRSNDRQNPELRLGVKADIKQGVTFDPPLLSFGEVRAGHPATQTIRVIGETEDFRATYASLTKGRIMDVEILESSPIQFQGETRQQTTLQVTLKPVTTRGRLQSHLTVRTNDQRMPLLGTQVTADIVGDVRLLPPRVNIGVITPGERFERMFRVNSRSGDPFKIVNVEQQTNLAVPLEVRIEPLPGQDPENASAYQVFLAGAGPDSSTSVQATIHVHTSLPGEDPAELLMTGMVRQQPAFAPPGPIDPGPIGPMPAPPTTPTPPSTPSDHPR